MRPLKYKLYTHENSQNINYSEGTPHSVNLASAGPLYTASLQHQIVARSVRNEMWVEKSVEVVCRPGCDGISPALAIFYPHVLPDGMNILGWNKQLLGSASIATAFMPLYQYVCNMGFSPNGLLG